MLCPLLALKSRLDAAHAQELEARDTQLQDLKEAHAQELQKLRDLHMEEKVELLKGLCEKSASAPTSISNVTNNNINLKDLNELEEVQVAGLLTVADFYNGQRGVAGALRRAALDDGQPWHHIKDENRGKIEVLIGGKKIRDDNFSKIIEKVEGPMTNDIHKIADAEIKREHDLELIRDRQIKCLNFKDGARNRDFVTEMGRRDG